MKYSGRDRFKILVADFFINMLSKFYYKDYFYNKTFGRFKSNKEFFLYLKKGGEHYFDRLIKTPNFKNHDICHEMFNNAFRGKSRMFIQMQDLSEYSPFKENDGDSLNNSEEVVTLYCSLLTLEMLFYDGLMFSAMRDTEDEDYKNAAIKHYRPYLFGFVAEINRNKYEEIKKLQKKLSKDEKIGLNTKGSENPYFWMECKLNTYILDNINFSGYILQSASNIEKIRAEVTIIENYDTPWFYNELIKDILDTYDISSSCYIDDDKFIQMIENNIRNKMVKFIDVYKTGNSNCIFVNNVNGGFFYDIGFNCKHKSDELSSGKSYNYTSTMKEIIKNTPSFFILSHWHTDHFVGIYSAKKDYFDKDWFAPDCYDACVGAKRLAKYLDLKKHLFLAERYSKDKTISKESCRLIGKPINIKGAKTNILATYKLYMGGKAKCDGSFPNCEGIVIEYTKYTNSGNIVVLMMGDVNYASFNEARKNNNDPQIADSQIEYLIAPHHGSEHTDYGELVAQNSNSVKKGELAIICCTNKPSEDRPNDAHRKMLEKRFEVITTEEIPKGNVSKRINL